MGNAALTLGALGTVAGIIYCILGIAAVKHLPSADATDRSLGWTLLWFTDFRRYTEPGKRLCVAGAIVFLAGLVAWVAFYFADRAV